MSESSYHDGSEADSSSDDQPRNPASRPTSGRSSPSVGRKRSRSRSVAAPAKRRLTGYVKKDYIQLLNQTIQTTPDSNYVQPLPPSQIGASFWTSAEKDVFFHTLARCGPGDLKTLADAVSSKSELEMHVYLKLLQAGVAEVDSSLAHEEVPVAAEISPACENQLEQTADLLNLRIDGEENKALRERNKDFLIDRSVAERYERLYQDSAPDDEESLDQNSVHAVKDPEQSDDSSSPQDGEALDVANGPDNDPSHGRGLPSSAELLSPIAFLDLSGRIFMNGPLRSGSNWRDYVFSGEDVSGPRLRQEALDDFHVVVSSLTRRLIQSAIFQAMSRLRAMDANRKNYTPVYRVTNVDVNTAANMLGMKKDRMQYWATLPRSYSLEVFSDSKKYNDGRPGSKIGHKLSYEEVEAELGLRHSNVAADEPVSDIELDDDDWTSVDSEPALPEIDTDDSDSNRDRDSMSPSQALRMEDKYLEALDMHHSREEEELLWATVHGTTHSRRIKEEVSTAVPAAPGVPPETSSVQPWRNRVEHEPQWVNVQDLPDPSAFEAMQARRRKKRELRQALLEEMHQSSSEQEPDSETSEDGDIEESAVHDGRVKDEDMEDEDTEESELHDVRIKDEDMEDEGAEELENHDDRIEDEDTEDDDAEESETQDDQIKGEDVEDDDAAESETQVDRIKDEDMEDQGAGELESQDDRIKDEDMEDPYNVRIKSEDDDSETFQNPRLETVDSGDGRGRGSPYRVLQDEDDFPDRSTSEDEDDLQADVDGPNAHDDFHEDHDVDELDDLE